MADVSATFFLYFNTLFNIFFDFFLIFLFLTIHIIVTNTHTNLQETRYTSIVPIPK